MNKLIIQRIALLLVISLMALTARSQVTIGSSATAEKGALLDLKQTTSANGGSNSTKGLLLPRVQLTSLTATGNDLKTTIKDATDAVLWGLNIHVGLTVYNVTDDPGKSLCPGVHIWDGTTWMRLPEPCDSGVVPPPPACATITNVTSGGMLSQTPNPGASVTVGAVSGITTAGTYMASYQWYSNTTSTTTGGTLISGATSASYTFNAPVTASTTYYYCEVSNSACGTSKMFSQIYITTVIAILPPTFSPAYNAEKTVLDEIVVNKDGVFVKGVGDDKTRGTGVNHNAMSAGVFYYTGGSGQAFPGATANANGITVTVPATTLENGAGELAVKVSGTPDASVAGRAFDIPITIYGQQLYVRVSVGCGAYTSSTRTIPSIGGDPAWKQFQCFNLGANTNLDPFAYVKGNAAGTTGTSGALYQWGRRTDGHQNRNSEVVATLATSNTPNNANFIEATSASDYNWRNADIPTLWGNGTQSQNPAKATNDPCSTGWKVPSQLQWASIFCVGATTSEPPGNATTNTWACNRGYKVGGALFLPGANHRWANGEMAPLDDGSVGGYWSSTTNGKISYYISFTSVNVFVAHSYHRAGGYSVRCISE